MEWVCVAQDIVFILPVPISCFCDTVLPQNKVDDTGIRSAQDAIERLFHLADKASKKSKLEAYHQQRKRDEEVFIVTSDEVSKSLRLQCSS